MERFREIGRDERKNSKKTLRNSAKIKRREKEPPLKYGSICARAPARTRPHVRANFYLLVAEGVL